MIVVTVVDETDVVSVLKGGDLEYYILNDNKNLVKVPWQTAHDRYRKNHPVL